MSSLLVFPGQGAQYANMGRDLYRSEPAFRQCMDQCCDLFRPHLERDLRDLRALSLGAAALLEQIAKDLQPQVLPTSTDNLEEQLLDHLQAVGR